MVTSRPGSKRSEKRLASPPPWPLFTLTEERKRALRALVALDEAKTQGSVATATTLGDAVEGHKSSGSQLARHLERFGLVRIIEHPGVAGNASWEVRLTGRGKTFVDRLREANLLLPEPAEERPPLTRRPKKTNAR